MVHQRRRWKEVSLKNLFEVLTEGCEKVGDKTFWRLIFVDCCRPIIWEILSESRYAIVSLSIIPPSPLSSQR